LFNKYNENTPYTDEVETKSL